MYDIFTWMNAFHLFLQYNCSPFGLKDSTSIIVLKRDGVFSKRNKVFNRKCSSHTNIILYVRYGTGVERIVNKRKLFDSFFSFFALSIVTNIYVQFLTGQFCFYLFRVRKIVVDQYVEFRYDNIFLNRFEYIYFVWYARMYVIHISLLKLYPTAHVRYDNTSII